jgi:hypothetical protein
VASPSCSFILPRKVVVGWPSHGDTEVANRARLWDSGQYLVSSNTSPTYGDAFRHWQASVCKTLAMATWDSQGEKGRDDRVRLVLGGADVGCRGSTNLEARLRDSYWFCHVGCANLGKSFHPSEI